MSYNYAKLRATVVAATSGPWEADIESGTSRTVRQADGGRGICTTFVQGQPKTPAGWESQRHQNNANSEYIAACDPETIRTLLGERDAQEAEIEQLREAVKDYLQAQDAADNNEYQSMPEDFGRLNGRRKAARDDLDAALSGEPT
ncbi:ead/Ea22-like family protein [Alcaligenes faecalis]|uniref:Uncharacterized protein n=1 Tax=Alcaligenes faecalis TaxID=511 RepID=A0AB33CVB7_ALCFA|nr:ead/Ea22-like family protein [Alcaligenes faecalis]ASR89166.1 hypothetical protein AFA_06735 [Alcaligenes faecalis]